jgi:Lipopolysaccharide-assembly
MITARIRRVIRGPRLIIQVLLCSVNAALFCGFALGCGYHTGGRAVTLPENIQTIAVPTFVNQTQTFKIEQLLTAAVVREMLTRTHYHIINQSSETADATLKAAVLYSTASPLTYDSTTGRASSVLVAVTVRISLTTREGKVLYENPAYAFRDQYQVSGENPSFFEEDSPALERLSQKFAQALVSSILEGF